MAKTPDFYMDGIAWEMKSPLGKGKSTLEHIVKKALRQSENIIIDLSRSKIKESIARKEIVRCFTQSRTAKRLKIITKRRKILEFKK